MTATRTDLDAAVAAADDVRQGYGELFTDLKDDLQTLVQQEIELAKSELTAQLSKVGKGAGMFAGAAVGALLILIFLSTAAWWGLANLVDQSWAALIVAGLWVVITLALALSGRAVLRSITLKPERTLRSLKQLPGVLTNR